MQPELLALWPATLRSVQFVPCGRAAWATEGDWLTTLDVRNYGVCRPATNHCVCDSPRISKEVLIFAERELIVAAEVEYVANVEISQGSIETWTKAGNVRRTVTVVTAAIQ